MLMCVVVNLADSNVTWSWEVRRGILNKYSPGGRSVPDRSIRVFSIQRLPWLVSKVEVQIRN